MLLHTWFLVEFFISCVYTNVNLQRMENFELSNHVCTCSREFFFLDDNYQITYIMISCVRKPVFKHLNAYLAIHCRLILLVFTNFLLFYILLQEHLLLQLLEQFIKKKSGFKTKINGHNLLIFSPTSFFLLIGKVWNPSWSLSLLLNFNAKSKR